MMYSLVPLQNAVLKGYACCRATYTLVGFSKKSIPYTCPKRCMADKRKNYYDVLQVPPDATDKEIKAAFVELSKELHPDKNHGNAEMHDRFVAINEAYTVLNKPESRAAYDYYMHHSPHQPYGQSPNWEKFYAEHHAGFDINNAIHVTKENEDRNDRTNALELGDVFMYLGVAAFIGLCLNMWVLTRANRIRHEEHRKAVELLRSRKLPSGKTTEEMFAERERLSKKNQRIKEVFAESNRGGLFGFLSPDPPSKKNDKDKDKDK